MNFRGKDTLTEALKNGLLNKREKKVSVSEVVNIAEAQKLYEESVAKPTPKDIGQVANALKPNRAPWAQKLHEDNKPAPKPIVEQVVAPKQKTIQELAKGVRLNKVEEKSLILNESTDAITSLLTTRAKRMWRPSKTESLEEKVQRLENEISKKKLTESIEDVEQLDELSASKLSQYMSKTTRDLDDKRDKRNTAQKKWWNNPKGDYSDIDKQSKKIEKRRDGLSTAYSKWNKKTVAEDVLNEEAAPNHKFSKVLEKHGYKFTGTHTEKSLGGRQHDFPSHSYEHPSTGGKVHVWAHKDGSISYHSRNKQKNGITAPGHGDTKPSLDKHLTKWAAYHGGVNEDIEQIDELSNSTLNSYTKKFRKSYDDTMDARSKNVTQPALKSGNMGRLDKDAQKKLDGYNRKLLNRVRGKDKANAILKNRDYTKEEVEQLDEDVSRNRHNVHLEYDNAKGQRRKQIIEIRGKATHADAAHEARSHYKAVDNGKNFHVKKVYSVNTSREGDVTFGDNVTDGVNGLNATVANKTTKGLSLVKKLLGRK